MSSSRITYADTMIDTMAMGDLMAVVGWWWLDEWMQDRRVWVRVRHTPAVALLYDWLDG